MFKYNIRHFIKKASINYHWLIPFSYICWFLAHIHPIARDIAAHDPLPDITTNVFALLQATFEQSVFLIILLMVSFAWLFLYTATLLGDYG